MHEKRINEFCSAHVQRLRFTVKFTELGIFGSYARGDYKATSDIDFYTVVEERPDRVLSGNLRQDIEDTGTDLVYIR